jgi:hypothetical protein
MNMSLIEERVGDEGWRKKTAGLESYGRVYEELDRGVAFGLWLGCNGKEME